MEIKGYFKRSRFFNPDNGYRIASVALDNDMNKLITVVGNMHNVDIYQLYRFEGDYITHPKFGRQFQVASYTAVKPTDKEPIIKYLSSPLFSGIGVATAEKIYDSLGSECLKMIMLDWKVLRDIKGITDEKAMNLQRKLNEDERLTEIIKVFIGYGLGIHNIMKLISKYGVNLQNVIETNPYQMIRDIDTISFKIADNIAVKSGFDLESEQRFEAALIFAIKEMCFTSGDTYTTKEALLKWTSDRCAIDSVENLEKSIDKLIDVKIFIFWDQRLYYNYYYRAEYKIAQTLVSRYKGSTSVVTDKLVDSVQLSENIIYTIEQRKAISEAIKNDFLILTGGPGTGKTTVTKGIVKALEMVTRNDSGIVLCAPTGRAARRLSEVTLKDAKTIHSLLKWDLHSGNFEHNEDNPLECEILIIDEFSMVEVSLFADLLRAASNVKKIIIIGDSNQLPSVGPGQVLFDIIDSKEFKHINLEKVHRQAAESGIIDLAYKVNEGDINFDFESFDDIRWFDANEWNGNELIQKIVLNALEKGNKIDDVQILAPKYNSQVGINSINALLQKQLTASNGDGLEVGERTYYIGDKILQLKNMPDSNVVNGDIGYVEKILFKDSTENTEDSLLIDFYRNHVNVPRSDILYPTISLGYCKSIHKAQGSEYDIVILPIFNEYRGMLDRKIIYTAITRAKKYLIILGEKEALKSATLNTRSRERNTSLTLMIASV